MSDFDANADREWFLALGEPRGHDDLRVRVRYRQGQAAVDAAAAKVS